MPLTANFLADFSSFINACASATASAAEVEAAGAKVGATLDQGVAQAAASMRTIGTGIADFGKKAWSVLDSQQLKNFAADVSQFSSGFIKDFAEAESATTRLEVALTNSGQATPIIIKQYQDMASELQKLSRYSDEAIMDATSVFTTLGKVGPDAMKPTLEAAMNLAAFMKIDLPAASKLMIKAAESDGESIGRLKIVLGDSYTKGMDFNQIVGAIAEKFKGSFAADVQTTAGSMENLRNQMSDVNELIGEQLAGALKTLLGLFHDLPEPVQKFAIMFGVLATALAPVLVSAASLVSLLGTSGLGAALLTAAEAVGTFLVAVVGWPAVIIAAIVALAIGIYKYWDEIVAFLKSAVDKITGFLTVDLPAAFGKALAVVAQWYAGIRDYLQTKFTAVVDWLTGQVQRVIAAFQLMYASVYGGSYVPDMIDGIRSEFGQLNRVMVDPALKAVADVMGAFDQTLPALSPAASGGMGIGLGARPGAGAVAVTVNMSGMLGTDDPQTRKAMADLVSNAVMQGMRGGRLLGTT